MRPRPFALPLSIGTDIVSIQRIFKIITKEPSKRNKGIAAGRVFAQRIMSRGELEHNNDLEKKWELWEDLLRRRKSNASLGERRTEGITGQEIGEEEEKGILRTMGKVAGFLGGRFAAKEAAIKAHKNRRLTYKDVWIYKEVGAVKPVALIREDVDVAQGIDEGDGELGWERPQSCPVSISHDLEEGSGVGGWAVASCLAWEGEVEGGGYGGISWGEVVERENQIRGVGNTKAEGKGLARSSSQRTIEGPTQRSPTLGHGQKKLKKSQEARYNGKSGRTNTRRKTTTPMIRKLDGVSQPSDDSSPLIKRIAIETALPVVRHVQSDPLYPEPLPVSGAGEAKIRLQPGAGKRDFRVVYKGDVQRIVEEGRDLVEEFKGREYVPGKGKEFKWRSAVGRRENMH